MIRCVVETQFWLSDPVSSKEDLQSEVSCETGIRQLGLLGPAGLGKALSTRAQIASEKA